MPNILVKIPHGAFPGESRATLVRQINEAAAAAEQMSDEPRARFMCWVLVDEVPPGGWTCGGADATAQYLPCMARVLLPAGVLDDASRGLYAARMHDAFAQAMPAGDTRRLMTSVVLDEVPDGTWGVSGEIWRLPDFARTAGFAHLQHLARPRNHP